MSQHTDEYFASVFFAQAYADFFQAFLFGKISKAADSFLFEDISLPWSILLNSTAG